MTQVMLSSKTIEDKFVSQEIVKEALIHNKKILDSYNSASGSLDDYDVVNEFHRRVASH
jgi:hypothetical protein